MGIPGKYEMFRGERLCEASKRSLGLYFTETSLSRFASLFLFGLFGARRFKKLAYFDPAAGSGNLLASIGLSAMTFGLDLKKANIEAMRDRGIQCFPEPFDFLKNDPSLFEASLPKKRPLFIIMNPPYRGKSTGRVSRAGKMRGVSGAGSLSPELKAFLAGNGIRSTDKSSFFIAQAARILLNRGEGYIGVFSPTNWLTSGRTEHGGLREYIFRNFGFIGGFIVNGRDFFPGVRSNMPVAFSVFELGNPKTDAVFSDLTAQRKAVASASSPEDAMLAVKRAPKAVLTSHGRTFFHEIFRAINAQTGDDKALLYPLKVKDGKAVLPRAVLQTPAERLFLAGTDSGSGYAVAVKPVKKKKSGCAFSIRRELPGPALAWHYLWDYQKAYPVRIYNTVPVVKKYAYTYIEAFPLTDETSVRTSGALREGCLDERAGDYIRKWLKCAGDLRLLWFFFFALARSKTAVRIGNLAAFRNMPVWCPDLDGKNASLVRSIAYEGYLLAKKHSSGRFLAFTLEKDGKAIGSAKDHFKKGLSGPFSEKCLFKKGNDDILKKFGPGELETALEELYPGGEKR